MNDGFLNEIELIEYVNHNNWSSYNTNIKDFLSFTFKDQLNTSLPFQAEKRGGQIKPDMVIIHNGHQKYISIKKGSGNSVHQEQIQIFFPFTEELYDEETVNNLKLFHYGDGTIDDSGKERKNANECQTIYAKEISQLNERFNKWIFLKKFLDRFLFIGNIEGAPAVDIIYHGTIDNGIWASREELYNYFSTNTFNSPTVHFASLTYQVWGRNNNFKAVHPDRRYVMQIKWGELAKDLKAIQEQRTHE